MFRNLNRSIRRNFDGRVAFSAAVGTAGMGAVAYMMHRSNVKALKKVANVASGKAK